MKLKLLALLAFMLNINAFASSAVVCRNSEGTIISSELLDYYEGRVNRNIPHHFDSQLSHKEYFEKFRDKVSSLYDSYYRDIFLARSQKLAEVITEFRKTGRTQFEGFIFTSEELTSDAENTLVMPPKGCDIERAITFQKPVMPGDPEFLVQKEVIKSLSEDGVRGLIISTMLNTYVRQETRYLHQKITTITIEKLNFRYILEAMRNHMHTIDGYSLSLMKYLPTGELFYDGAYVLTDDGQVDREKTLTYGVFKTTWRFYPYGETWSLPTVEPKGSVVSIKYEDGRVVQTNITDQKVSEQVTLKAGFLDVNLYIPAQIVKPALGIFEQSLIAVNFYFNERTIFPSVKVGLKKVNLTKTLEVTLNEKDEWTLKEINQ